MPTEAFTEALLEIKDKKIKMAEEVHKSFSFGLGQLKIRALFGHCKQNTEFYHLFKASMDEFFLKLENDFNEESIEFKFQLTDNFIKHIYYAMKNHYSEREFEQLLSRVNNFLKKMYPEQKQNLAKLWDHLEKSSEEHIWLKYCNKNNIILPKTIHFLRK